MNRRTRRAIESARLGRPFAALVRDSSSERCAEIQQKAVAEIEQERFDVSAIVAVRRNPPKRIGPRARREEPST